MILSFILIICCFFETEALSWKTIPSGPKSILLGSNLTLVWDYKLDPGETTQGFFQVIWARKEPSGWNNLAVKSSMSGISILRETDRVFVDPDANATFILINVKESDHTTFRCSIESKMSLTPTTISLNVLVPGKVLHISENESFIEGNSVTLSCQVKGNPSPSVAWLSPNGTVLQNKTNNVNNSYTIPHMYAWHVGRYRCVATNIYGSDEKVTYIYLPPKISTIHPTAITVNESGTISLFCNATGLPKPFITWKRLNGKVIGSGELLAVANINRTDSGLYICTASNGVLESAAANSSVNVQFTPSIIYRSKSQSITENQTLTLYCNATGNPVPTIQWTKVGGSSMFPKGNILNISAIQESDGGSYKCTADNGILKVAEAVVSINVLVSPKIDVLIPSTQVSHEGKAATFFCNATGNPTPNVTWTRLGDQSNHVYSTDNHFTIPKTNRSDSGIYVCTASNGVIGPANGKVALDVHYSPAIVTAPSSQTLNETNPLKLYCNSTGNPSPNITWVKDDRGVINTGEALYIKHVKKSDEGTYVCVASNKVGKNTTASAMITVIVYYAPIMNFTQSNITINETGSTSLHCNATGNPTPTIQWWRIRNGSAQHVLDGETLELRHVRRNESGDYRCTASNGVGNPAVSRVNLNVQYKPMAEVPSPDVTVNETNDLSIQCQTTGNPTPVVTWIKNGTISTFAHGSTLTLTNVTRHRAGTYHCRAVNILGTVTASVHLTVQYKPINTVLYNNGTNDTIAFGKTLHLRCQTNSVPITKSFSFYQNGMLLNKTSTGVLDIPNVQRSHAGLITCHPRNLIGVGETAHVNLTVVYEVPPRILYHTPNQTLQETKSLLLHCNASGFPTPKITWLFTNNEGISTIRSNQKTVYVAAVTRNDDGIYVCHAENGIGETATAAVDVVVQYKPTQPIISRVEPYENSIQLTWTKPKDEGRSPISLYTARVKTNRNITHWSNCMTNELSCVISNVQIDTGYTVVVQAQNQAGKGTTDKVEVVVTEHEIRLLDKKWSDGLANQATTEYNSLTTKLITKLWAAYTSVNYIKGIGIVNLRSGSVIANIRVTRLVNTSDHLEPLKYELKDGYLGDMRAEFFFPSKGETGASTSSNDGLVGGVISFIIIFIIVLIVFALWYRRKKTKKVKLVESKANTDGCENEEGNISPSKINESFYTEDEGIEMDTLSDIREGGSSRLSVNINSPRTSRPSTPIIKNRVHPATDMQQENRVHTEGDIRTTQNDLGIPTEYAHVLEKSGTRDRLYAELAWLEKKGRPKRRQRLPSISGSASVQHRKYSILEILQSQQQQEQSAGRERSSTNTSEVSGIEEQE